MKIFLGNAPWSKEDCYGVRAGSRWPHFEHCASPYMPFPFFLAYSAALLKKNGFDVMLVDAIAERISEDDYFDRMKAFAPELVVHEVATASFKTDLRQGEKVKELLPDAKLLFCGAHHAMYDPAFLGATPFVDYVIEGEYEFALLDLVQSLESGGSLEKVAGVVYRSEEGTRRNGRRELGNLDELPWPAREFLPMHNYWDNPGELPAPSLQLHTSRGCPFRCHFCVWPQIMYGGNKYRTRDPLDVVAEIVHCRDEYGFTSFYFDDDTFNIGKKRIMTLCNELVRCQVNLPWAAMARADTADHEMLVAMREAGLVSIKYGVEAGDQDILNNSGKRLQLDRACRTIRETKELGIKCHLTFTLGLPGETQATMEKTLALADQLDPDTVQFSIITPFPGSRLYSELKAKGHLLSDDFDEYDGSNRAVIRTDELSPAELEEGLKRAQKAWYMKAFKKKSWRSKLFYVKEAIKHPVHATKMIQKMLS